MNDKKKIDGVMSIKELVFIILWEFAHPVFYVLIFTLIVRFVFNYPFNLHYVYMGLLVLITGILSSILSTAEFSLSYEIDRDKRQREVKAKHDPINFISRLDVDLFELRVGEDLVDMAEKFATEDDGIIALRSETADTLGFILSTIRVRDFSDLEPYEYNIAVRDNVVASGHVYPDKFMVLASEWDSRHDDIPEDAIVGVEPIWQTQVYWIDKETADKNKKYIAF